MLPHVGLRRMWLGLSWGEGVDKRTRHYSLMTFLIFLTFYSPLVFVSILHAISAFAHVFVRICIGLAMFGRSQVGFHPGGFRRQVGTRGAQ